MLGRCLADREAERGTAPALGHDRGGVPGQLALVAAPEPGADLGAGGAVEPFAALVLRTPLARAGDVGDEVVHGLGARVHMPDGLELRCWC